MFFDNSSKGTVLKILSEEWPLSAKEIYSRASKLFDKEISYQAVHKILNFLVEEKILDKKEGKYLMSLEWVQETKLVFSKLEQNLVSNKLVAPLHQKFIFGSVHEVDKFLVESCKAFAPNSSGELMLQWVHFWIPLFISKDTYKEMKEIILNSNFYSITPNNSPIDQWCAKFWKDVGVKERVGAKLGFDISFLVYQDMIIQVFYPKEIRTALEKVYNSTNDPSKLDIDNFFTTVFEKKTRIPVLVSKNKEVANELRNQIKAFF